MRVLIACEFSGIVRNAFRMRGHDAWSCDLLPCEADEKWHLKGDVFAWLQNPPINESFDLMIAHPPCTYLCNSGVLRLYKGGKKINGIESERWRKMEEAAQFFKRLLEVDVPHIAVENPVMHG